MMFKTNKPTVSIMDITPNLAELLLATSPGNRRIRSWHVDVLAGAMRRGEWRITSQGIGIDVSGRLRDAHHRLNAVIKSGATIQSVVVTGLSEDANSVTDIGIKRTLSDLLEIGKDAAAVIRLAGSICLSSVRMTPDQLKPLADSEFKKCVDELIDFSPSRRAYVSSASMQLAAVVTVLNGGDADFVFRQYRALCLCDYDDMSLSAKALCRQIADNRIKAVDAMDTLARGLAVFDVKRKDLSKIQINESTTDHARTAVKKAAMKYWEAA